MITSVETNATFSNIFSAKYHFHTVQTNLKRYLSCNFILYNNPIVEVTHGKIAHIVLQGFVIFFNTNVFSLLLYILNTENIIDTPL